MVSAARSGAIALAKPRHCSSGRRHRAGDERGRDAVDDSTARCGVLCWHWRRQGWLRDGSGTVQARQGSTPGVQAWPLPNPRPATGVERIGRFVENASTTGVFPCFVDSLRARLRELTMPSRQYPQPLQPFFHDRVLFCRVLRPGVREEWSPLFCRFRRRFFLGSVAARSHL
jgi:hypothetical protein